MAEPVTTYQCLTLYMDAKQQNSGREPNEIGAPAKFHFKPISFRPARAENQAFPGELTEVGWPVRSNQAARIINHTYKLSDL